MMPLVATNPPSAQVMGAVASCSGKGTPSVEVRKLTR